MWKSKETAPKDGYWIVVYLTPSTLFTVRWVTPFAAAPELADWRDERGKVRQWKEWQPIKKPRTKRPEL